MQSSSTTHRRELDSCSRAVLVLSAGLASAACHAPAVTRAPVSRAPGAQDPAPPPAADVPPISTDRPGFLFAPTVLTPGRLQVETGPTYTLVRSGGDDVRAWTLPIALRYGASETLELRASLPTWTETRVESGASADRDEGPGDTEVGAKLALPPLAGGPLALQGSLRLPTGADDFTTDELGASAYLLHGRDLGASFWFQTLAGASYLPIDGAEDQTSGALAALVSHPLAEGWSAFVEATALPGLDHAGGQSYLGTAVIWTPRSDLQLDLSADFGLDGDSADVLAAFGLSWFF